MNRPAPERIALGDRTQGDPLRRGLLRSAGSPFAGLAA
jgi:hypothetical protein